MPLEATIYWGTSNLGCIALVAGGELEAHDFIKTADMKLRIPRDPSAETRPHSLMASTEAHDILYRGSVYLAATTFVSGISCGIMTALYSVCIYNLLHDLHSTGTMRRTALLTVWITILWMLSSVSAIANAYCTIYAYTWEMGYPGGPPTYLNDIWSKPVPVLVYSTYIITTWLADAMMVSPS